MLIYIKKENVSFLKHCLASMDINETYSLNALLRIVRTDILSSHKYFV